MKRVIKLAAGKDLCSIGSDTSHADDNHPH